MPESFLHDAACVEVRTGEDGTWITLKTKNGGGYTFQPINLNDLEGCIAKWCQEREEEATRVIEPECKHRWRRIVPPNMKLTARRCTKCRCEEHVYSAIPPEKK